MLSKINVFPSAIKAQFSTGPIQAHGYISPYIPLLVIKQNLYHRYSTMPAYWDNKSISFLVNFTSIPQENPVFRRKHPYGLHPSPQRGGGPLSLESWGRWRRTARGQNPSSCTKNFGCTLQVTDDQFYVLNLKTAPESLLQGTACQSYQSR